MSYPGEIGGAIAAWLKSNADGSVRQGANELSEMYRKGQSSTFADLASYLTVRAPATFAAISDAICHTSAALPDFAPTSCLDIGCGPGTASWAALQQWPDITQLALRDTHAGFLATAQAIASHSGIEQLASADIERADILSESFPKSDLVIAAYVLAELSEDHAPKIAAHLWRVTNQTLIIIEPGTPRGFARIKSMRETLIGEGALIAAPCTHTQACPMQGDDWCHFSVRLPRSRAHMHAKSGILPYEDEPFAYFAATRATPALSRARILAPPQETKYNRTFKTCSNTGLATESMATRDKPAFKRVRKLRWGDELT